MRTAIDERPDYRGYLRSDRWRAVRYWALERAGWCCEMCGYPSRRGHGWLLEVIYDYEATRAEELGLVGDAVSTSAAQQALRSVAIRPAPCPESQAVRDLQVHHFSYARLGREHPDDVCVLCPICHVREHLAGGRGIISDWDALYLINRGSRWEGPWFQAWDRLYGPDAYWKGLAAGMDVADARKVFDDEARP